MNRNEKRPYVFSLSEGHADLGVLLPEPEAREILRTLRQALANLDDRLAKGDAPTWPKEIALAPIDADAGEQKLKPLFETGLVFVTQRALRSFPPDTLDDYLADHAEGRWGDLSDMADANESALLNGGPVVSGFAYGTRNACSIVTDADRSKTMIMTEDEFDMLKKARGPATDSHSDSGEN